MKWNFFYQITAASRTPDKGLPPPHPRSLCPLSSAEFVETPPNKISVYATGISCGLSFLVSVRISCLILLYGHLEVTLDHLLDEATSTPDSHSEMVLEGVGVFSVVKSFISLYKWLIIEMKFIPYGFLLIQHTLGNYNHY